VYLRDLKHRPVQEVTYEQLRLYFVYLIDKKGLGENQIHSRINALKFYYEQVLLWERFSIEIPRPKKQLQLPKVLSFEEVQRILTATGNIKHMLILSLCYGTGIRLSEIVNIEIEDMDLYRHKVFIRRGKGKKDRYVNLPTSILVLLGQYMNIYKPQRYLFEGQYGGRYSVRSVQSVFMQAKHRAGVYKKMGIHGLRHSFATHCHEQGTDLHLLQRLLGHSNIKTTLIYTHVSQRQLEMVVSPLDRMLKELGPDMKQISSKRGGNNT
jgi:site-specific recombinase XerD